MVDRTILVCAILLVIAVIVFISAGIVAILGQPAGSDLKGDPSLLKGGEDRWHDTHGGDIPAQEYSGYMGHCSRNDPPGKEMMDGQDMMGQDEMKHSKETGMQPGEDEPGQNALSSHGPVPSPHGPMDEKGKIRELPPGPGMRCQGSGDLNVYILGDIILTE